MLASIYEFWGRLDRAEEYATRALTPQLEIGPLYGSIQSFQLARIECLRERPDAGRAWLEKGTFVAPWAELVGRFIEAWLQLQEKKPADALETTRKNRDLCRRHSGGLWWSNWLLIQEISGLLELAATESQGDGHLDGAAGLLRILGKQGGFCPIFRGNYLRLTGESLVLRGKAASAEKHFGDALKIFQKLDHPLEAARTLVELGRVRSQDGDGATTAFRDAEQHFRRAGAGRAADRVLGWLEGKEEPQASGNWPR